MSEGAGALVAMGERERWIVSASRPGAAVRFSARDTRCPDGERVWVEVRALSHREALERESLGVIERYELAESGKVLALDREYDFWAMAAYDYRHSLVAFALPGDGADGIVASDGMSAEERVVLLGCMPPALAEWVQDCIDQVNLRDAEGLAALLCAQKKPAA
jgi:hypothetical protein